MTGTTVMTPDAQAYFNRYLRKVRAALRGHPSVDADEVERDVIGHVSAELGSVDRPVTISRLQDVLERLGSPEQWISADELPLWRRVVLHVRTGPEDWRLAYICLATWTLSPMFGPPLGPFLFLASFPLARATVTLIEDQGDDIGARRWLIYPPLAIFYAGFLMAFFGWPGAPISAVIEVLLRDRHPLAAVADPIWVTGPGLFLAGYGLWWLLAAMVLHRFPQAVRLVFYPFANWFEPRHARRLMMLGVALFVIGGAALLIGARV
jgi:hypothetical protein